MDTDEDRISGHCSLSLEQLCRIAMSSNSTSTNGSFSTTAVRLLISRGRPMYNIDTKVMQVSSEEVRSRFFPCLT